MPEYYQYPNTVYDQAENILALLGSWWADDYASRDQTLAIVQGKSQIESQTTVNILELLSALSRHSVPIYHKENWYPLQLLGSQLNAGDIGLAKYGETATYGDGTQYDIPTNNEFYAFPKPASLVAAPILLNRFTAPSLSLAENIDFRLTDTAIIFQQNPFNDSRVASRKIYADGVAIDTEITLWVYRGDFDWDTIYEQFAYVIGARLQSSQGYREVMNSLFDALVGGNTRQDILNFMSAISGIPLVIEMEEVIKDIVASNEDLLIITDLSVYKFDVSAVPAVTIGDTVTRGESLTTALQFYELNTGRVPEDVRALALGKGFLATCFYADLVFENRDVPLIVDAAHASGYTKVTWGLGGFATDVAQFFDDMHTRGVLAAGQPVDGCAADELMQYPASDCDEEGATARRGTLAHFLDHRQTRVGEPTAAHLPLTINPLEFLAKNILRNNAFIVRMQISAGKDRLELHNIRLLRKVLPAHTAMILILDMPRQRDIVTDDILSETITTFTGMTPISDTITTAMMDASRVSLRVVH